MLKKRLATDESLSSFGGQFVPLRLVTSDDNPAWIRWKKRFPFQGQSIPVLFVVRADGQQVFGQSGSLPGDALPQMLKRSQELCGEVLTREDQRLLKAAVEECEQAFKVGDLTAAANALAVSESVGPLGRLNSYAKLAIRVNQLADQIGSEASVTLLSLEQEWQQSNQAESVLNQIRQLDRKFGAFPKVGPELDRLLKREVYPTRIANVEVESDGGSDLSSDNMDRLAAVSRSTETLRTWTCDNGSYSLQATLVAVNEKNVELQSPDGQRFGVELDRLDVEHQEYLRGKMQ